ncbi:MAG: oligosaccharide flippase family protein, partial [Gemmatimonadaceae bacterium]
MAGRGIGARFAALGGGEALARLAAFVVTVYLARVLGPALFGSIAFATAVLLYLTQLADAGIELVGIPLVARSRQQVDDAVAPVMGARVLLAAALTALTLLVGLTLLPQPDGTLLALYALTLPLAAASTRWVHLGLERTGWVAAARLAGELLALALIVLLLRDASQVYYVPVAVFA